MAPRTPAMRFSRRQATRTVTIILAGTFGIFLMFDAPEQSGPLRAIRAPRASAAPAAPAVAPAAVPMRPAGLKLSQFVMGAYPNLRVLYERLHSHPELSLQEALTSSRLAQELDGTGFQITRNFAGYGLVAVLRNGPGPTVLVRTEMDALPVEEETGLPYASRVHARDRRGNDVGVMHACGHDVHMTCWVGAARTLAAVRDRWSGTLVFIAQPAEEVGSGA